MTDTDNSTGGAPRRGPMSYGMAPVATAGVLGALLLGGLAVGGTSAIQQMAAGPAPAASTAAPDDEAQETTGPGEADGTDATAAPGQDADGDEATASPEPGTGEEGSEQEPSDQGSGAEQEQGSSGTEEETTSSTQHPGHPGDPGWWEYDAAGEVVHFVQWGDTLSLISREYLVSVNQIAWYNGIEDVNVIYADSVLRIPFGQIPGPEDVED